MRKLITLGLVIFLMTSIGASAQTATGNIYGKATDASGAVLPGASVTVSGEVGSRTTVTGADGTFRFLNLDPREYTVTVTLQGFGSANRKVSVTSGVNASLEVSLRVGGQAETVERPGIVRTVGAFARKGSLLAVFVAGDVHAVDHSARNLIQDATGIPRGGNVL